jgi:hypothetical protein
MNSCVFEPKVCDYCQKCFHFNNEELEYDLYEYDYWCIYQKIQKSSFSENEKIVLYENIMKRIKSKYTNYVQIFSKF